MRPLSLLSFAAALAAIGATAPQPAQAFGDHHAHYVLGSPADPYSYVPEQPRYYPYYNSGQWKPLAEMRYRTRYNYTLPPYYQAWGWNSKKWYLAHGKSHRHWDLHR